MKFLAIFALQFLIIFSSKAFATVDAHDKVFIVVQNIHEPEEFFVERVPIIGCYGLARGPQLIQFTMEYKVTSNIGCGGEKFLDNINYLVCANIVEAKESDDYSTYSKITLDISKCEAKSNPKFITMLRTAAKYNFPNKKKEVELKLIY